MARSDDHIKKWLEGDLSAEEIDKMRNDDPSTKDLEKIIETTSKWRTPSSKSKSEAWEELASKIGATEKSSKVRKLNPAFPIAIAAALALVVVAYIFLFSNTVIETSNGERITHILPDGSEVVLNAASTLSYQEYNWSNQRSVHLTGEAYFKVESGSTFAVKREDVTITVLGTAFNAYLRDRIEVSCYKGSVKVSSFDDSVILERGELARSVDRKQKFEARTEAPWISGEFYYENTDLKFVLEEIERQYAVDIKYEGVSGRTYTGYFNDKNLEEALQLVLKPMGLSYQKEGDKIIVK